MKAVQVTLEEDLLEQLDASEEVKRDGRSAVLRRAIRAYLRQQRRRAITEQYEQAYAPEGGLGEEYEAWEDQGEWPPS